MQGCIADFAIRFSLCAANSLRLRKHAESKHARTGSEQQEISAAHQRRILSACPTKNQRTLPVTLLFTLTKSRDRQNRFHFALTVVCPPAQQRQWGVSFHFILSCLGCLSLLFVVRGKDQGRVVAFMPASSSISFDRHVVLG